MLTLSWNRFSSTVIHYTQILNKIYHCLTPKTKTIICQTPNTYIASVTYTSPFSNSILEESIHKYLYRLPGYQSTLVYISPVFISAILYYYYLSVIYA